MILLIRLERWLLFITLTAIIFPLSAEIGPVGVAPFMMPLAVLVAVWMIRLGHGSPVKLESLAHFWPMLFVGVMFTTSSFATGRPISPGLAIWFAGFALMLYSTQNYGRTFDFRSVVAFLAFIMICEIGLSFFQLATGSYIGKVAAYFGDQQDVSKEIREIAGGTIFQPVGTFSAANLLGTWLMLGGTVLYAVARWHKRISQWATFVYGVLIVLTIVLLVLATSRANLGVLILSLFALEALVRLKLNFNRWAVALLLLFGVVLLVTTIALLFTITGFNEEIGRSELAKGLAYRLGNLKDSMAFRLYQYSNAAQATLAFPVFGMGFGYSDLVWQTFNIEIPAHFHYRPHNIYLIVSLEAGLLAGIVFAGTLTHLLVRYLCKVNRHGWQDHAIWVGSCGLLALGLVYITPLSYGLWPMVCFWIGMLMAVTDRPRRNSMQFSRSSSAI